MPDGKNTGEWPEVEIRRYTDLRDEPWLADSEIPIDDNMETERYLPIHSIRERLHEAWREWPFTSDTERDVVYQFLAVSLADAFPQSPPDRPEGGA